MSQKAQTLNGLNTDKMVVTVEALQAQPRLARFPGVTVDDRISMTCPFESSFE